MRVIVFVAVCLAAVAAVPSNPQKIVGGSLTTISQYPSIVALLYSTNLSTYLQTCGGTIINSQSILTSAQCIFRDQPIRWRVRVGATYANSGGVVHSSASFFVHPNYDWFTSDNDIAIIRTVTNINYVNQAAQPALIAGSNYNVGDNQVVWAAGWGRTHPTGAASEQLRHVQVWTVNQAICRSRYFEVSRTVTDNMLCSGWLDVGGRDHCYGDSGGPIYHNNVVVGIISWGYNCALARYPGVNTRVSAYTSWIEANA